MSGKLSTNDAGHRWADSVKSGEPQIQQNVSLPELWQRTPKIAKIALGAVIVLWLLRGVVGFLIGALFTMLAALGSVIVVVALLAFIMANRKK